MMPLVSCEVYPDSDVTFWRNKRALTLVIFVQVFTNRRGCIFKLFVSGNGDGINLDLYVGVIDTVVEPARIMVCR